jgi:isopropylmalate/homocitrate/citramalate synthase
MRAPIEPLSDLFVGPRQYTRRSTFPDPALIRIYDTTLRDGEQMPGVALSAEQKYVIARELSDIGCHIIDLGFPSSSPSEQKALQMVLKGKAAGEIRDDVEILVMCRSTEEDIDTTVRTIRFQGFSPADVFVLIFTSASPLHCKYKIGPTLMKREGFNEKDNLPLEFFHEANKRMVSETIAYARSRGLCNIEFGAEDASRTRIDSLVDLVQVAVGAGATRYVFADTTGSLTPESTALYCRALRESLPGIELVSHFHNDFDLATVNVITGLANGFTTLSTTVNGIGERAGNAPLHSVVASLKYLYGVEIPGFRYERLGRLKKIVESLTGIPVQPHEPVVGLNVYSHESGIHAHGVGISRSMYEAIPFEEVGGDTRFVYGKHSGAHSVLDGLLRCQSEIDVPIDRDFALRVLKEVKAFREADVHTGRAARHINEYYENLRSLGLNERQLINLARRLARSAEMNEKHMARTAGQT